MPDDKVTPEEAELYEQAFASLQAQFNSDSGGDEETNDDEGEETTEDEETNDESTDDESESTDDDDEIEVEDGIKLKRSDIAELHRLRQFLDGDTADSIRQSAQALEQARLNTTALPANLPTYTPPAAPEGLDLEDPAVKAIWERQTALEEQLFTQSQIAIQQRAATVRSDVERAVGDWNGKYKLDDKTLDSVRQAAANSQVAVALENSGKPIYDSVHAALESAFWADPNLRNKYLLAAEVDLKKTKASDDAKKRKLGALSGRGSSTSHSKAPTQMTADERRAAMVAEITEHLNA